VRRSVTFPSRGVPAALLAAAVAAGCGRASASAPATAPPTTAVRRATVEDVFLLTGEVQAVRSDELTVPRAEGGRFQVRWMAEEGEEVEAGQAVVELDNAQVAQGLEEKRQRLTQAHIALEGREAALEAEMAGKRLDLQKAEVEAEKTEIEASVPQDLRSRKEWHEKQQLHRAAQAALQKARLAVTTLEATGKAELAGLRLAQEKSARQVHLAETSVQGLSLHAPRAGIVLLGRAPNEDRPLQVGDNLWAGWRVASIPDLASMEVVAYLPEVDEGRVAPGQPARVVLDAHRGRSFDGRVEEIAAVAQDVRYTSGFKVRVSLASPDPALLRPGLSARVEVVRRVFPDALLVPRRALLRDGSQVHVRPAGPGDPVPVEIAACLALECVVSRGLSEGDRVAVP
jgi:HlyD family secretion protein